MVEIGAGAKHVRRRRSGFVISPHLAEVFTVAAID
jgi:hypothetical protein